MVGGSSNRAWFGAALVWRLFLAHLHQRLVKARGRVNYYDTLITTIFLSIRTSMVIHATLISQSMQYLGSPEASGLR